VVELAGGACTSLRTASGRKRNFKRSPSVQAAPRRGGGILTASHAWSTGGLASTTETSICRSGRSREGSLVSKCNLLDASEQIGRIKRL